MLTKELVLQSLDNMPAEFSADEFFEKIIFLSKIEQGIKDGEEGRVHKHEDIRSLINRK